MHAYITDSSERKNVPLLLAAVVIGISLGLSTLLDSFKVSIPAWIDITSVPLLYGIFYALFDKYWWRWRILRQADFVKVPILGGVWRGRAQSSFDEFQTNHEVEMRIEQHCTRLRYELRFVEAYPVRTAFSPQSSLMRRTALRLTTNTKTSLCPEHGRQCGFIMGPHV